MLKDNRVSHGLDKIYFLFYVVAENYTEAEMQLPQTSKVGSQAYTGKTGYYRILTIPTHVASKRRISKFDVCQFSIICIRSSTYII